MAEHKKSKSDRYIIGAFVAIGIISYFAFRIIIEPELIPITVLMFVFSLILAAVSLILLAIIKALNLKISGLPGDGLSEEILQRADGFLKIPMVGFTESLNISVSAAIIIQNLTNRLRNSNIDWHLSENEILEKRLSWAKNSIKDIKRIEERYFEENPR